MQKTRKLLSLLQASPGFTLIELLVVIGILGILAAGLLATIDPFEQLNKAQDSNLKNAAAEFLNANIRYFVTHNGFPWDSVASGGADCANGVYDFNPPPPALSTIPQCLTPLVNDGEIKQGFTTFNGLSKMFVSEPNPQTGRQSDLIVCFKPVSKSQQKSPDTKFNQDGTNGTSCKSAGGTLDCYWCAQ